MRHASEDDVETRKLSRRRRSLYVHVANVTTHGFGDFTLHLIQLIRRPLAHKLDSTVGQIPYKSGNVMTTRDPSNREAKANSLDVTRVVNVTALPRGRIQSKSLRLSEPQPPAPVAPTYKRP